MTFFQYSLPYSQISCPSCGRYSNLFSVVINKHKGDSYCNIKGKSYSLLLSSLLFLLVITKRYSTYSLFTAFVSKSVFVVLQIPHKNIIQFKTHRRGDKERWKTKTTQNPLRSPKSTFCCFGEGKPLNLLTLTQGSAILSGIQSPADNWRPGLVCVVAVVCPFELNQRAPAECSP